MPEIEQLRKALIHKAREQVKEHYGEMEVHVIRAVNVLRDLDAAFNLLAEHVIEWYGAHFPELNQHVKDNGKYLQLVSDLGERKNFTTEKVSPIFKEKAGEIAEAAKKSMGSEISGETLGEIRKLAKNALELHKQREILEAFIQKEMEKIAPNFTVLAGAVVGARLLSSSGSLKGLAMQPASTMQLLGAEKALFRHLRNRRMKGPKHGFIFQHPLLRQANIRNRGKIARSLAAKLCIAARADFFGSKKEIGAELEKELEERAKSLK